MDTEQRLRTEILDVLKSLDCGAYPCICKHTATKAGYQYIEKQLIEAAIEEGLSPISAVAQLETQLSE